MGKLIHDHFWLFPVFSVLFVAVILVVLWWIGGLISNNQVKKMEKEVKFHMSLIKVNNPYENNNFDAELGDLCSFGDD